MIKCKNENNDFNLCTIYRNIKLSFPAFSHYSYFSIRYEPGIERPNRFDLLIP